MAAIRGMVEVVLVVEDIDRSVAFYQDTLGLEPISPPELPVKFLRIGAARDGAPSSTPPAVGVSATNCPMPQHAKDSSDQPWRTETQGYGEESDVSRYFGDARVLSIFEGAEEVFALRVIARSLLDG